MLRQNTWGARPSLPSTERWSHCFENIPRWSKELIKSFFLETSQSKNTRNMSCQGRIFKCHPFLIYVSCHVTVLGLKTLERYMCLYWCWSIIHQIYIIGDWYHREGLLPGAHPPPASAPLEFKTRWEVEISRWGACLSYPSLIPVGQSEIRCESTWDRRKEEPPSSEEGNINGKSEIQLNQIKMIVLDIPGYAVRTHHTAKLMGRYQFQTNKRFSITIPNIWMHSLFIMTRSIVQNSD